MRSSTRYRWRGWIAVVTLIVKRAGSPVRANPGGGRCDFARGNVWR
ncbi:hypothetical protein KCP76_15585 [Salmonella enterica subsp. enterica serovar Weltevreden]|nr:hypothetical protein KCP76_15585 [Salmonella enterica subsp. enterica serovar Weltevreden]